MDDDDLLNASIDMMWAISVMACRPSRAHIAGIEMHHDVLIIWAISEEEVIGKAINKYADKHPSKDGWSVNVSKPVLVRQALQEELGGFRDLIKENDHVE